MRARARRWEPTAPCQHWESEHKYAPLPAILPLASISIFPSGVRTSLTNIRLSITLRHETQVRCGGKRFCFTAIFLANLTYRFCLGRKNPTPTTQLPTGPWRAGEWSEAARPRGPGWSASATRTSGWSASAARTPGRSTAWTPGRSATRTSGCPTTRTSRTVRLRRPDLFLSSHLCASCPWICCHRGRE